MRIFVLCTDAFGGRGGIAKFNRDLLSALCANPGVEEVIALPRLMLESPGELPAKLRYPTSSAGGKLRYIIAVLSALFRVPRPDLIICAHINLLPIAFLAHRLSALRGPCPLLLVIHGIDAWQPTRSSLTNRLVRKIDGFISVSEFTRKRFLGWTKLEGVRSFILPNSVDLAQFSPGPKNPGLLDRYNLRGRTVLLTVARLSAQERYKGIDEVMEVLPGLAEQIPNLTYLIVGDGNDRARLEQKAVQLDIRDRVIFAGHIPESEKVDHYRLADTFVMPGWGEGFGIVYLEAMGCGIPVVASELDASREAVRNGELGIVVNPREPDAIRSGILAALGRERGVVPPGLDYFSAHSFETRVHRILEAF